MVRRCLTGIFDKREKSRAEKGRQKEIQVLLEVNPVIKHSVLLRAASLVQLTFVHIYIELIGYFPFQ